MISDLSSSWNRNVIMNDEYDGKRFYFCDILSSRLKLKMITVYLCDYGHWFLSINLNRFVQRNLISKNKTDIFMNIMLVTTK